MRCTLRNKQKFYCCQYTGKRAVVDADGHDTGEKIPIYGTAKEIWANISPATGMSRAEQFGNLENYDKVIVTNDLSCPINENSVLFIDKVPSYTSVIAGYVSTSTSTVAPEYVTVPVPDYTVSRVAKSLNSVSIAARKITVE